MRASEQLKVNVRRNSVNGSVSAPHTFQMTLANIESVHCYEQVWTYLHWLHAVYYFWKTEKKCLSLLNKVKTRLWKANQDQETKEKQEVYIGIIRLLDFFK